MSPFIRHYISLNSLQTLVKPGYNFDFDIDLVRARGEFNKVSGKLNAFVRDAISQNSTPTIPPVREFEPSSPVVASLSTNKKKKGPLTDQEIENAIGDLFDYFNVTFGTLMQNLSEEGQSKNCFQFEIATDLFYSVGFSYCSTLERYPLYY